MADFDKALSEIDGYPKALSQAGGGSEIEWVNIEVTNASEAGFLMNVYGAFIDGAFIDVDVEAGEKVTVQMPKAGDAGGVFMITSGTSTDYISATGTGCYAITYTSADSDNCVIVSTYDTDAAVSVVITQESS